MKKLIRFDLPINGIKAKNLEELQDNLTFELPHLARSGKLSRWLMARQLDKEAEKVIEEIARNPDDEELFLILCKIIGINVSKEYISTFFKKISIHIKFDPNLTFGIPGYTENSKGFGFSGAELTKWNCREGDMIEKNFLLIEAKKSTSLILIQSPASGRIRKIIKENNALVWSGDVIAYIEPC